MDLDLSRPTHRQLRHFVTEKLRLAILEGELKPGEWLRQEKIAQDLGVSQMPVREALKELTAQGLVEELPYRGVRVVEFTPEDIADLYAHRAFLEGMAASAAAKRITPDEIERLKELQQNMLHNLDPRDLATYRELNRQFHLTIIQASRHAYLIRTLLQMWASFPTMLLSNFALTADQPLPERDAIDYSEHTEIILALERHDSLVAQELLHEHIQSTARFLLLTLKPRE